MQVKQTFSTTLAAVCNLIKQRKEDFKTFLEFFHLVHNSCQSHNGLIRSRPSWRQWAGSGLMQHLWFSSGLCGLWSAEKSVYFDPHSFFYASYMRVLSVFLEKRVKAGACCAPLCVCCACCATVWQGKQGGFSVLTKKTDLLSASIRDFHRTEILSFAHNQIWSLSGTIAPEL